MSVSDSLSGTRPSSNGLKQGLNPLNALDALNALNALNATARREESEFVAIW